MRDVLPDLLRWWESGATTGMGTVVGTWRSAPRPAGAAMLVGPDGTAVGSVSRFTTVMRTGRPRSNTSVAPGTGAESRAGSTSPSCSAYPMRWAESAGDRATWTSIRSFLCTAGAGAAAVGAPLAGATRRPSTRPAMRCAMCSPSWPPGAAVSADSDCSLEIWKAKWQ